jgi:hypothetical protein
MAGTTVLEVSANRIKPGNKQTRKGSKFAGEAHIIINCGNNLLWIAIDAGVEIYTTDEVCGPHAGGQSLTADIPESQHYLAVAFVDRKEVAGEVSHCKDLARDFKLGISDQARSAKPSMDLCGFKNLGMKLRIVLL